VSRATGSRIWTSSAPPPGEGDGDRRVGGPPVASSSVQYAFPGCAVLVDTPARYVETRFADGTRVGSTPNRDAHSLRLAEELGYGDDTWTMSRDHELAHTWLAHLSGRAWSRTMWHLAHPDDPSSPSAEEVAEEEAAVLAFQAALDKAAPRPWDVEVPPERGPLPW
jgi:hypothetical protein